MKILDRYILKKFLSTYVFTVFILLAIVLIIDFSEKNDDFMKHSLSTAEILGFYKNFLPYIANLVTPITVFIATVFVTSQLAGRTELVAMLSAGISFRRLLVPYAIGSFLIAAASFYLTGWVIPDGNKERVAFEVKYFKSPYYFSERDIHIKVGQTSYLYLQSYNNRSDIGYRPTLETIEGTELKAKLSASRMQWNEDKETWTLKGWELREFQEMGETITRGAELDTLIKVHPKDFGSTYHLNETFTIPELDEYIVELKDRGADNVKEYEIEKLSRYMSPFAVLVLTFIGVVVSARKSRGGTGLQIAIGFVIAFIFIILFIASKAIAETEVMPSVMAIWLPNIIFTFIGLFLYRNLPK